MALSKGIDKLLAAFGSEKAGKRLQEEPMSETRIEGLEENRIAVSEDAILYGQIEELNEYLFLETILVTRSKIKTLKGATLTFKGTTNFKLISDTQEIESDLSNVSNRILTRISFDITEKEINLIKNKQYESVIFECKKIVLNLSKST
ncbi:hypothetical protein [Cochleicola gelatinilyticus]|uniref:Uncharacterized protein n=1 Tax=Cochleicola gelatinilyticus TaxID=1763537 RepID=A0A167IN80_9FLAO|nr:hypothetical protein [Cochleicola gelatinilyticus]OAB79851.1 hypothetical protein ULVI_03685 [Cochleicola gelatinilyticus]